MPKGTLRNNPKARALWRQSPNSKQCPICLDAITKYQKAFLSRCQPVPHARHMRCWKKQTDEQQERCAVGRQCNVDDLTFIGVAMLCGVEHTRATVTDLTLVAKGLLGNYQLGVLSRRELWSFLLWRRGDGDRPSHDPVLRVWSPAGDSLSPLPCAS